MLLDQLIWNLKSPKRLDLPLGRTVPDRVRPPEHVICPERFDDLAQEMRADCRRRRHQLPEGRAQLHIDVSDPRLRPFHLAELGGPRDLSGSRKGLLNGTGSKKPGVVDQKVDVREIFGRLDQIAGMVVVRHRPQWQSLVDADPWHAERPRLLQHRVGHLLVIHPPAVVKPLRRGARVAFPGIHLQRAGLQVHQVQVGPA